jgi:peptidoglycan/xylan/chitin deacetylase (PgdA/CDA1 family)
MNVQHALLRTAKGLGAFRLAHAVRGSGLPILGYHGFSFLDEHRFRPHMFMTSRTFEQRLLWLRRHGFRGVPLVEAIERLARGRPDRRDVVITIDDGFFSAGALAWPLLRKHGFPATLYVTSYYMEQQNPVFRLAVQYLVWHGRSMAVRIDDLLPVGAPQRPVTLGSQVADEPIWRLIRWAETSCSEDARTDIARRLAERVGLDYGELRASRRLSLLSRDELQALAREGLDIQLHTHRHRLPVQAAGIIREVSDNRAVLEPLVGRRLQHLCYPSGIWSEDQWETLRSLDIRTATTCNRGFNGRGTPLLALKRFLDSERLPQVEFEAEISGFKSGLRWLLGRRVHTRFG